MRIRLQLRQKPARNQQRIRHHQMNEGRACFRENSSIRLSEGHALLQRENSRIRLSEGHAIAFNYRPVSDWKKTMPLHSNRIVVWTFEWESDIRRWCPFFQTTHSACVDRQKTASTNIQRSSHSRNNLHQDSRSYDCDSMQWVKLEREIPGEILAPSPMANPSLHAVAEK